MGLGLLLLHGLFAKVYGGEEEDKAFYLLQTQDGGYAVTGHSLSFGGYFDILVIKLDLYGSVEWAKTYGEPAAEDVNAMVQTSDGGYAVTGYMASSEMNIWNLLVMKLSSDGSLEWVRTFGGKYTENIGFSIIQTSDGGYAVAGLYDYYSIFAGLAIVIKLAPDGSVEWARLYGGDSLDYAYSIIQTSDGGYAVAGVSMSFGDTRSDMLVMKLAPDGSVEWAKLYGGSEPDGAWSIIQTSDGGYVVLGSTRSFGMGDVDLIVMKLAPDGSVEWAKTYGWYDTDYGTSIAQAPDGGYIIVGGTENFGVDSSDFLILKISSDGTLEWAETFGGPDHDKASSVVVSKDYYTILGSSKSFGGDVEFLLLKLKSDGSYSGCDYLKSCSPGVTTPEVQVRSPALTVTKINPKLLIPTFSTSDVSPRVADVCEETQTWPPAVLSISHPGGLLFKSQKPVEIKVYSASGRLVKAFEMKGSKAFVPLKPGVYIWSAGELRGKGVVAE